MRLKNSLFISVFFFLSCGSGKKMDKIESFFRDKNSSRAILISCIKCKCIIDELNRISGSNSDLLSRYEIYGDPTCLQDLHINNRVKPIMQSSIDSISTDFYNLVIYNQGRVTMVKTEKAELIEKYLSK